MPFPLQMDIQTGPGSKPILTDMTTVGFLLSMFPHVQLQILF